MKQLSTQDIMEVSGGTAQDAGAAAIGIFVGGAVGFLVGGPVGAAVGAADAAIHLVALSRMTE